MLTQKQLQLTESFDQIIHTNNQSEDPPYFRDILFRISIRDIADTKMPNNLAVTTYDRPLSLTNSSTTCLQIAEKAKNRLPSLHSTQRDAHFKTQLNRSMRFTAEFLSEIRTPRYPLIAELLFPTHPLRVINPASKYIPSLGAYAAYLMGLEL
ncbi:MAG: hypothetical protein K9I59_06450 [Chlorobium sp.]|jgi:hypothetical protein|uniref:hypothetical protein n=1 Tax=Chlorobium sp. TaxID=1095 RepID=UPI001D248FEA|nr:hypothetical protein [Chlorobium sp.]MBN1279699.1 hypothetical protein [Chlorobiaceae bacterium]MCF8216414.1 hypothetical protein [Chlorobium sp.]MCF8271317.1 hypothetical protein [Chlorobium sp.]MCF8287691.1 hypothetical protein [Chlorobium sp.]MCF8291230.1 hypothetical protein [Chlorobium sp.]